MRTIPTVGGHATANNATRPRTPSSRREEGRPAVTRADATASLAEMLDERRHLLRIAEWMFGAVTADQVVHETYRRWYELDDAERASIAVPRAWLTRVAGGICLDLLADCEHGDPAMRRDTVRRAEPHRAPDPITAWG
ncbi:sigma-70 family RNA polymerase sigma factor family protein [Actinoallomurus rhizosphaericola]|uniref:sigma factor n=1 Tax=Actinoallomurus rhizosphaericola TaxID=2952536 RepID=UPI0020933802|nr:sigma factor [Actinoallomurus rhizosphaericola]MCO5995656.1 hypothetical protein [Actinoallomurus rhizosphaericola]